MTLRTPKIGNLQKQKLPTQQSGAAYRIASLNEASLNPLVGWPMLNNQVAKLVEILMVLAINWKLKSNSDSVSKS
eukprot:2480510-Amphidinium_carterae.1